MRFVVTEAQEGQRLDKFLMEMLKPHMTITRSSLASYIQDYTTVNNKPGRKGQQLKRNEVVEVEIEDLEVESKRNFEDNITPKKGKLEILEETSDYIVLNKPSGVAVHPGVDNETNTIANYLRFYLEEKGEYDVTLQRGGIVHRLDKLVSGLLICAKTRSSQLFLQSKFENREVVKLYLANVEEKEDEEGKTLEEAIAEFKENEYEPTEEWRLVEGKISRDRANRMRMILGGRGKEAITYILPLVGDMVLVNIKTGRMHQIRATLKSLGMVIKGDELYGSKSKSKEISLKHILLRLPTPNGEVKEWSL